MSQTTIPLDTAAPPPSPHLSATSYVAPTATSRDATRIGVIPRAPHRHLFLLGNHAQTALLAAQRRGTEISTSAVRTRENEVDHNNAPSDQENVDPDLSSRMSGDPARRTQSRPPPLAEATERDDDDNPGMQLTQVISFFYTSPLTRLPQCVTVDTTAAAFPHGGTTGNGSLQANASFLRNLSSAHPTAEGAHRIGMTAAGGCSFPVLPPTAVRGADPADSVSAPQTTKEVAGVAQLRYFRQRLFEPVELQVETLSALSARLLFGLWYAMLLACIVVEVLPQAQWGVVNICGGQYAAGFKNLDQLESPCMGVSPSPSRSGYDVTWASGVGEVVGDNLKLYRRIVLSIPRPVDQVEATATFGLSASVTYQNPWGHEEVTFPVTLVCRKKNNRCDVVRLPEDLVLNHGSETMTVRLLNVPQSIADAVRATLPYVGMAYQKRAYTLACLIWRYTFLLLSMLNLLRFVAYRKYTSPLYEQTWVIILQLSLLWYLNPMYALHIVTKPLPKVLAFIEFRIPTYFMGITNAFMFSVMMASMSWTVSTPLPPDQPVTLWKRVKRALAYNCTVLDPPFWTKLITVLFVVAIFILDVVDAATDASNWSSGSNCQNEFQNEYWGVVALLSFGDLVCLVLLLYLRGHLGGKPYLESRPQQLACRVFLAVFLATIVYYIIHYLVFFVLYNEKYASLVSRQPFLQLPALMVACGFVNIMTLVYTTRSRGENVPIHPMDARWKHMVWPNTWYCWLARSGGSQYIFETEREEIHFYRIQLEFRKRQWMAKQKRRLRHPAVPPEGSRRGPSGGEDRRTQDLPSQLRGSSQMHSRSSSIQTEENSCHRVPTSIPMDPAPAMEHIKDCDAPVVLPATRSAAAAAAPSSDPAVPSLPPTFAPPHISKLLNMDAFSTYYLPPRQPDETPAAAVAPSPSRIAGASAGNSFRVVGPGRYRSALEFRPGLNSIARGSLLLKSSSGGHPNDHFRPWSSGVVPRPHFESSTVGEVARAARGNRLPPPIRRSSSCMNLGGPPTQVPMMDSGVVHRSCPPNSASQLPSLASAAMAATGSSLAPNDHANAWLRALGRCRSALGKVMGAAERNLIELPAKKLNQLEAHLFEAVYRPFLAVDYLPFFNLETAIDCYNMSWEAYGQVESAGDAVIQTGIEISPGTVPQTIWHGVKTFMCGCCPASVVSSDSENEETEGRVAATAHEVETAVAMPSTIPCRMVVDDTSFVASAHCLQEPQQSSSPLIALQPSTPMASHTHHSRHPSPPSMSLESAGSAAATHLDVEGEVFPINVRKYGYEQLLVSEAKEVQVVVSRMDIAATEHQGKAPRLVIAFRGTANLKNAKYDANLHRVVWREMEKPLVHGGGASNTSFSMTAAASSHGDLGCASFWRSCAQKTSWRPTCHAGFTSIWRALRPKVIPKVLEVLRADPETIYRVFATGHSLGGALASLCAYSITRELLQMDYPIPDVTVYTFGQPRLGNRTFQKIYNKAVPRTFRVINESDMVATMSAFGGYHVGIEVDIDRNGNFIVKPSEMEKMFTPTKGRGLAIMNHLMTNYGASLNAIAVRTQCPARGLGVYTTADPGRPQRDVERERVGSTTEGKPAGATPIRTAAAGAHAPDHLNSLCR